MDVQDLTRYLFLHIERHILNQQSTDSMRGIPWLSAMNQKLDQTSQTLVSTVCCHHLGHQRKRWNFLPPIYDQSP